MAWNAGLTVESAVNRSYRAKTLLEMGSDLKEEIEWLNEIALKYQKNYQIWYRSLGSQYGR